MCVGHRQRTHARPHVNAAPIERDIERGFSSTYLVLVDVEEALLLQLRGRGARMLPKALLQQGARRRGQHGVLAVLGDRLCA